MAADRGGRPGLGREACLGFTLRTPLVCRGSIHFLPRPPERSLNITNVMTSLTCLNTHSLPKHYPHCRITNDRNSSVWVRGPSPPGSAYLSRFNLRHLPPHISLHMPRSQVFAHMPCKALTPLIQLANLYTSSKRQPKCHLFWE